MATTLFFDAGPIISLVMSRLAWIIPELKKKCNGTFYITPAVKYELVDRPINVKRFEFEALQVLKLIREGVLEVYDNVPQKRLTRLRALANGTFRVKGKQTDIIQSGELESLACALELGNAAIAMDERTLRLFIEDCKDFKELLEKRFQSTITADAEKMKQFTVETRGITIIRSIELVGVAYKLGLLEGYVPQEKNGRGILVDSVLWAVKFNGCAVTEHEIEELKSVLLK